jgi:hypothetical protein
MCSIVKPEIALTPQVAPTTSATKDLDELEREICELAAHLAAATCRWLMLVAEFDERLGWAEWGVKSCAHWLSWRCSIGLGTARDQVRVARRLQELPRVHAAFATGELSYSKVRAITRVATPEIEENLVELALHASGAQLDTLVRGYSGALAVTLGATQEALERRYLQWNWEDDGSLRVAGRLSADDGALLVAALRAAEDEEAAERRDAGARNADALITMARSTLADAKRERASGDPCEVVVHVDAETLADDDRVHDQSRLADGPGLAPETVRRLGCDASLVRIVERDGQPLSVGRRTRTIPPALRRALRAREEGCLLSRVHASALSPRSPHQALGPRRRDEARKPRHLTLTPSPLGPRRWIWSRTRRLPIGPVSSTRRAADSTGRARHTRQRTRSAASPSRSYDRRVYVHAAISGRLDRLRDRRRRPARASARPDLTGCLRLLA